jgi:hypothetical protein
MCPWALPAQDVEGTSVRLSPKPKRPQSLREQWQTILHCLEELRVAYSPRGEALGTVEIKSRVETFFVECDHLRDWLKHDLRALPGVTANDIREYALKSSPALSICYAICNTHKHHTRDQN